MKKTLLSGVKPTGRPHIGNYFGAMKQFVDLQNSGNYQCYLFIADYHGLNFIQNGEEMRKLTLDLAIDYLAIGLDPKQSILFKQSDVSAHTELAWIFDTLVTVPYLMQAHAFKARVDEVFFENNKDKSDTFREMINKVFKGINVGTFNYPVLMAADILLYDTDVVPVGADQKQHIEYARDIAEKFNHVFKTETFKLPEAMILESVATVPGVDGRKMSKSYNNTIELFATREEITKAVMSIVTDSGLETVKEPLQIDKDPRGQVSQGIPKNVYAIHKLLKSEAELKSLYETNKGKYKVLKEALIEDLDAFIKPMRERRAQLAGDIEAVNDILKEGGARANLVAGKKLEVIKRNIGVL